MKWFIHALKNIFTYQGRARRAEFGWFYLTYFLISIGVMFVFFIFALGGILTVGASQSDIVALLGGTAFLIFFFIYFAWIIVMFLTSTSLITRRLHDLGWSGWWQLVLHFVPQMVHLFAVIPFLSHADNGYLTESEQTAEMIAFLISGIVWLISIGIWCILLFKDGQRYANKYGEDPKAIPAAENSSVITTQS